MRQRAGLVREHVVVAEDERAKKARTEAGSDPKSCRTFASEASETLRPCVFQTEQKVQSYGHPSLVWPIPVGRIPWK